MGAGSSVRQVRLPSKPARMSASLRTCGSLPASVRQSRLAYRKKSRKVNEVSVWAGPEGWHSTAALCRVTLPQSHMWFGAGCLKRRLTPGCAAAPASTLCIIEYTRTARQDEDAVQAEPEPHAMRWRCCGSVTVTYLVLYLSHP